MVDRIIGTCGPNPTPDRLVDACLDIVGPLEVSVDAKGALMEIASRDGQLDLSGYPEDDKVTQLMQDLLKMVVSSREYQLA